MRRIGIVSNVLSRQNRHDMAALRGVLARYPDVARADMDGIAGLSGILGDFARREVEHIVVNGGDGTVQAVLTEIFNGGSFERTPSLSVLPGGMTNLIAADVGLRGRRPRALAQLLTRAASGEGLEERTRAVLSVSHAVDRPPIHGMFLGTGAFHRTVLVSRGRVHPTGATRSWAAALSLGLFLWDALRGRGVLDSGHPMAVAVDEGPARHAMHLALFATTLERFLLGLRPFWGEGEGGVRYTLLPFPPRRFRRALLPLLRGRPRPWMPDLGYESGRADEIAFAFDGTVVFDGELLTVRSGLPVQVRADRRMVFLALPG